MTHGLPGRAGRRETASSVAPVASGYERSLRPCLALAHHTRSARPSFRKELSDEPRPQRPERLAAGFARRPVEDQRAVEVVELVLDDACGEVLELVAHRAAVLVRALEGDA